MPCFARYSGENGQGRRVFAQGGVIYSFQRQNFPKSILFKALCFEEKEP
jgi:hypothetical protein